MTIRARVFAFTATAAAGALLLVGCGGPVLPPGYVAPPPSASSRVLPPVGGGSESGSATHASSPGAFNSDCLGVAGAYSSIVLAMLPSLGGGTGSGTYDSDQVMKAIGTLGGAVPAELKGDFQTFGDAAKSAAGKNLADAGGILGSPAVAAATDHIGKWMTANCGS